VGGTGGEHAHALVAAQARWAHFQAWLVFQGLVEQKQQPDMADLLQARHGITLVERRQQLQHATRRGCQVGLARDGELFLEAGADDADR